MAPDSHFIVTKLSRNRIEIHTNLLAAIQVVEQKASSATKVQNGIGRRNMVFKHELICLPSKFAHFSLKIIEIMFSIVTQDSGPVLTIGRIFIGWITHTRCLPGLHTRRILL